MPAAAHRIEPPPSSNHVVSHAEHDASDLRSSSVRRVRTGRVLSAQRMDARQNDAADLTLAIERSGLSFRLIADELDVDESTVRHWCDPHHDAFIGSGEIDAWPSSVVDAYYSIKFERRGRKASDHSDALLRAMERALVAVRTNDEAAMRKAREDLMAEEGER